LSFENWHTKCTHNKFPIPVNLLSKKANSSNRKNLKKFGKAILFKFLSVLILKYSLRIIQLYGVNILTCYNPKLTFEEINLLVLYTGCPRRNGQKIRESVPYVELYRYNPKHLYPKLNGYGDNGHRKVWVSGVSTYCTPSVTPYSSTAHARQPDIAS